MDRIEKQKFFRLKLVCIVLTMTTGAWSTLTLSFLDRNNFSFTLFQTLLMFGAELMAGLSILIFAILKKEKPKSASVIFTGSWIKTIGKKGFCFAAFFDFLSSIFITTSYIYLPTFGVMGFKMILLILMVLYRKLLIKRKFYRHQFLGFGLTLVGIILVTVQFALIEEIENKEDFIRGFVLMIFGQIFLLLDIICMEFYININRAQVETVLIIKGSSGVIISLLSYVPMHYIFESSSNHSDLVSAFIDIHNNKNLVGFILMLLIALGIFNSFFIQTLKITDSLAICTVDCGRMILTWVFSYVIFIDEKFYILEIFSAVFMGFGLLIYNEVLILPFWGLDKSAYKILRENQTYQDIKNNSRTWQTQLDSLVLKN